MIKLSIKRTFLICIFLDIKTSNFLASKENFSKLHKKMHMKKLLSFVIFVFVILMSCEEPESSKQVSAEVLSKNSTFISIMKANRAAINRFEFYLNSINLKKGDINGRFANQVKTETDYSKLIVYLGYENVEEFESVNSELNAKYVLLFKSYPELKDDNRLKIAFKEAASLYLRDNEVVNDQSNFSKKKESAKMPGCEGGVACIKNATLCQNEAETDFAITSAGCNSFGFNPVGWAFCQAGANLSYAADMYVCSSNLQSCCNLLLE
jgi:hypothetical protein